MKHVRTEVILPFAAAQVWDVLTDFQRYSEWNPLNVEAIGQAVPGAHVRMKIANPLKHGSIISQAVTIVELVDKRRLAWRGHIPLVFTGTHYFELLSSGQQTQLVHGERISGLFALTLSAR